MGWLDPKPVGQTMDDVFDSIFQPTPRADRRTDGEKLIGAPKREPSLSELLASLGRTKD